MAYLGLLEHASEDGRMCSKHRAMRWELSPSHGQHDIREEFFLEHAPQRVVDVPARPFRHLGQARRLRLGLA